MTLNDMASDPLNMIFLYLTKIISIPFFYYQVGPGTTIGYIINVKINFSNDY